jgi:hypothetical protein
MLFHRRLCYRLIVLWLLFQVPKFIQHFKKLFASSNGYYFNAVAGKFLECSLSLLKRHMSSPPFEVLTTVMNMCRLQHELHSQRPVIREEFILIQRVISNQVSDFTFCKQFDRFPSEPCLPSPCNMSALFALRTRLGNMFALLSTSQLFLACCVRFPYLLSLGRTRAKVERNLEFGIGLNPQ